MDEEQNVIVLSKSGLLAQLKKGQKRFNVLSRSMVEKADIPLKNGLHLRPGFAVIAFEHRVVIFDLKKRTAVITFTQMASFNAIQEKIVGIVLHKDTLFVANSQKVFKRFIDFPNLASDLRLADPSTWDELKHQSPKVGSIFYDHKKGIQVSEYKAFTYSLSNGKFDQVITDEKVGVWVNGDSLKFKDFWDEDEVFLPQWMGVNPLDSCRWILSSDQIWQHCKGKTTLWKDPNEFPAGVVTTVSVRPGIEFVAWMHPYQVKIPVNGDFIAYDFRYGSHYFDDSKGQDANQPLKTMVINDAGFVFTGTWGGSVFSRSPDDYFYRNFHKANGDCMDSWSGDYSIVRGVNKTLNENTMFFSYWGETGENNYGIAWLDDEHNLYCGNDIGSSMVSGPILSIKNSKGNYDVFSVYEHGIGAWDGDMDFMTLAPTRSKELKVVKRQKVYTGALGYARDISWDTKNGRLWLAGISHLGYYEPGTDSVIIPLSIRGIESAEYTALEVDRHGDLWVGTRSHGVFHIKLQNNMADSLLATNITSKDGLLSNTVLDLAIDGALGRVIFAHDIGVSVYHTFAVRFDEGYLEENSKPIKVYPNPFRPGKHQYVTIDNINSTGAFNLFNSAGKVVKTFSSAEMVGGGVKWDGIMANGELAPPGVYHYVVRHNNKAHRGRLLIIR